MKQILLMGSFLWILSTLNAGFVAFGEAPEGADLDTTVRPLTGPYFHEDAFVTTDVRAWYLVHHFYADTIGGAGAVEEATVTAVQLRVALTPKLQFVAYKDGYTDLSAPLAGDDSGWNDIGAGLKYALIQDWDAKFHLAAGIGYEISWGDQDVLQDTDEYRLWLSINKSFDKWNLGGVVNYLIADDNSEGLLGNSDLLTIHLHFDYTLTESFSPVVELNGYFVTEGSAQPFSGVDAVSISGGKDEDTVTIAFGGEYRATEDISLRVAYETELTNAISLFGHRWTFSAVYEF